MHAPVASRGQLLPPNPVPPLPPVLPEPFPSGLVLPGLVGRPLAILSAMSHIDVPLLSAKPRQDPELIIRWQLPIPSCTQASTRFPSTARPSKVPKPINWRTTPERMAQICDGATGFLYCVAHAGVTGNSQTVKNEAPALVAAARKMTATPLAIGFGIDGPAAAATAAAQADAVIIGTAVLAKLKTDGVDGAGRFIREIRAALDAEPIL